MHLSYLACTFLGRFLLFTLTTSTSTFHQNGWRFLQLVHVLTLRFLASILQASTWLWWWSWRRFLSLSPSSCWTCITTSRRRPCRAGCDVWCSAAWPGCCAWRRRTRTSPRRCSRSRTGASDSRGLRRSSRTACPKPVTVTTTMSSMRTTSWGCTPSCEACTMT